VLLAGRGGGGNVSLLSNPQLHFVQIKLILLSFKIISSDVPGKARFLPVRVHYTAKIYSSQHN